MKDGDAYMPWWIGDYLGDTMRLNTLQHGAYMLILADYWRQGPPPHDVKTLASITKLTPRQFAANAERILSMFRIEGGQLRHARLEAERAKATQLAELYRKAGQAGAAARHGRKHSPTPDEAGEQAPPAPAPLQHESATTFDAMGDDCGDASAIAGSHAIAIASPPPCPSTSSVSSTSPGIQRAPDAAGVARAPAPARERAGATASDARLDAVSALREVGLTNVSPTDPRLLALLAASVTIDDLRQVGREAVAKGNALTSPFAWVVSTIEARRKDAHAMHLAPPPPTPSPPDWRQSQTGVIARATALGMPSWDEYGSQLRRQGKAPHWLSYRQAVIEADQVDDASAVGSACAEAEGAHSP